MYLGGRKWGARQRERVRERGLKDEDRRWEWDGVGCSRIPRDGKSREKRGGNERMGH